MSIYRSKSGPGHSLHSNCQERLCLSSPACPPNMEAQLPAEVAAEVVREVVQPALAGAAPAQEPQLVQEVTTNHFHLIFQSHCLFQFI